MTRAAGNLGQRVAVTAVMARTTQHPDAPRLRPTLAQGLPRGFCRALHQNLPGDAACDGGGVDPANGLGLVQCRFDHTGHRRIIGSPLGADAAPDGTA